MDRVLEGLGWLGRYQKGQFVLLMMPVLDCALHVMSFIFIGRNFDYKCARGDRLNSTLVRFGMTLDHHDDVTGEDNMTLKVTYESCRVKVTNQSEIIYSSSCVDGYEYSQRRDKSFVSEFDLVCANEALSEVTQTVMSVGMLVGAFFCAYLSDRFGRKPVYVTTHVLLLGVAIATAFVPNYAAFLGARFFLGALQQGVGLTSCIMLVELLPTSRRAFPSQVGSFSWAGALLCLGLVAYLCRDLAWRHTELVLAAVSCYSLLQGWLLDESLRWLTANGHHKRAEKIILKAAKTNKVEPARILKLYKEDTQQLLASDGFENHRNGVSVFEANELEIVFPGVDGKPNLKNCGTKLRPKPQNADPRFAAFFQNRRIFFLTANACYMWFTDSMAYYGLLMTSSSLADDLYLDFTLGVLVEFPAALALATLVNRIGRRYCAIISHSIGGLALMTGAILGNHPAAAGLPGLSTWMLVVNLLGKFGITFGFAILWLYTPELFPTTIRSTAFGICSLAARVGGMIAPYSRTLERHYPWAPGVTFATLTLVIPLLAICLPETKDYELPQTVADMAYTKDTMTSRSNGKGEGRHTKAKEALLEKSS